MTSMLHPVLLIAAAVNDDGHIELPAAAGGTTVPFKRALFAPGADGALLQSTVPQAGSQGVWAPLEMDYFARCLGLALGALTPGLFAVRGVGGPGSGHGRLQRSDAASRERRERIVRAALLAHHVAYEERLV